MAYIAEATLETAIENVSLTLLENKTLPGGESAWQSWQEVIAYLHAKVTADAAYVALSSTNIATEFGGV